MNQWQQTEATKRAFVASAAQPQPMTMALAGELNKDEAIDLALMIERLIGFGSMGLVVDFSEVTHFDYRGVPALMKQAQVLRDRGGDIKLAGFSRYLFAIFKSASARRLRLPSKRRRSGRCL